MFDGTVFDAYAEQVLCERSCEGRAAADPGYPVDAVRLFVRRQGLEERWNGWIDCWNHLQRERVAS